MLTPRPLPWDLLGWLLLALCLGVWAWASWMRARYAIDVF